MFHIASRTLTVFGLWVTLTLWGAPALHGQVLDTADIRVTLDSALGIARKAAAAAFPELPNYLLNSFKPRVLLADPNGGVVGLALSSRAQRGI